MSVEGTAASESRATAMIPALQRQSASTCSLLNGLGWESPKVGGRHVRAPIAIWPVLTMSGLIEDRVFWQNAMPTMVASPFWHR